jgi:hypothetical protein
MIHLPEIELIVCSVDMKCGLIKVFMRGKEELDFLRLPIDSDPTEIARCLFEKTFNTSSAWLSFEHNCSRFSDKLILTYVVTVPEEVSPMVDGEWKRITELGDKHAELVKKAVRA